MQRRSVQSSQWVFMLTATFLFGAAFLRALLLYSNTTELSLIFFLLGIWLVLAATESTINLRQNLYFPFYLTLQTVIVVWLLSVTGFPDFFATLLFVLSMQAMVRLKPKSVGLWIGACAVLLTLVLFRTYQGQAAALALSYSAGNILFGSYTLAMLRSQETRARNESLAEKLQETNANLNRYSKQAAKLALAKERNRLALEMHDSVTQTVFSMSLVVQSAGLMLERNQAGAEIQLQRLAQLSRKALEEMKLLVSELHTAVPLGGIASALFGLAGEHYFPNNLKVSVKVQGNRNLNPKEEQVLFRIAREALHNAAKHAHVADAEVRLCLTETPSLEVSDKGQGFDLDDARTSSGLGLKSMNEQASEIGWTIKVTSSPGSGTIIKAAKKT